VQTHAGITFSDDKLLQTRVFSYADAQRYRLGVNYQELPINKPKCPFHANEYDGAMQMAQKDEEVDYWPSNFRKNEGPTNGATTKNAMSIQVRRPRAVANMVPNQHDQCIDAIWLAEWNVCAQ
jgi:catalase